MITEKHFSLSHAAFWHQLLPMTENYIRECNTEAARFAEPLQSGIPADQRGIINEVGFRLFAASLVLKQAVKDLSAAEVATCVERGVSHISQMRQLNRGTVGPPDPGGLAEAILLAERLEVFFARAKLPSVQAFPAFPGCGWLEGCCGDLLSQEVLFEVKAGDRGFRGSDIRQVLCYCALNFASKAREISEVCLVNPRSGRYFTASVEYVAQRVTGRPAVEVLADIIEYVSEPFGRDLET